MFSFKHILPLCRSYATKANIPKRLPEGGSGEPFVSKSPYLDMIFPKLDSITPESLTVQITGENTNGKWYNIRRTRTGKLPVYLKWKGTGVKGPNTFIRRIDGDIGQLKQDLKRELALQNKQIWIDDLTKQIFIKGNLVWEVKKLLRRYF